MTSTSTAAHYDYVVEVGADFVDEFYIPGAYASASGYMHIRFGRSTELLAEGVVTMGAYDSTNDWTPVTITISDTVTAALGALSARYDFLTIRAGVKEYWQYGKFTLVDRVTQPGVP